MKWDTKYIVRLRTRLTRMVFTASVIGAMVLSAIAESTWD
jgi:hypothetical protein